MRTLIAIVFTAAIAWFFVLGGAAQAQLGANCSQACSNLGDLGLSHGQCVSLCQTCNCLSGNGNTCAVCECKVIQLLSPTPFALGRCVSFFRQNGICVGNISGLGCEF